MERERVQFGTKIETTQINIQETTLGAHHRLSANERNSLFSFQITKRLTVRV